MNVCYKLFRLQETELTRERLQDQHLALEKSLRLEREQREQLEETLSTMQEQARLAAENKEVSVFNSNLLSGKVKLLAVQVDCLKN